MAREEAERMAAFCLRTGRSRSEYYELTRLERDAFLDQAERLRR